MSISSTFHTSSKAHAITGAASLAKVAKHNSRGYFSWMYESDKIHDIIGRSADLKSTVTDFLNEQFAPAIEAYNEKQRRTDRRINVSAAEYFSENKNLDLANEMIFQIGDKAFWDQWRTDTRHTTRKGKEIIIKEFPEEIMVVMDGIFERMIREYEHIYESEKETILAKLRQAKADAESFLASIDPERIKELDQIQEMKGDRKKSAMKAMSKAEKEEYGQFIDARATLAAMSKQRLIERTEQNQMHIKVMAQTGHYDEFSPHAHGISVCWTDGYKTGLSSRVAKSAVLNRWTLEVIQDKMHEIAKEEIERHPEAFRGRNLAEKGKGRNFDYTTEQIARKRQIELQNDLQKTEEELNRKKAEVEEWDRILDEVGDEKEYVAEAEKANGIIETLRNLLNELVGRVSPLRDKTLERSILDTFRAFYEALTASLRKLRLYEVREHLPEEECRSTPIIEAKRNLDEQIASGKDRASDQPERTSSKERER